MTDIMLRMCDQPGCGKNKNVQRYRIYRDGGRTVNVDLCVEHAKGLEAYIAIAKADNPKRPVRGDDSIIAKTKRPARAVRPGAAPKAALQGK